MSGSVKMGLGRTASSFEEAKRIEKELEKAYATMPKLSYREEYKLAYGRYPKGDEDVPEMDIAAKLDAAKKLADDLGERSLKMYDAVMAEDDANDYDSHLRMYRWHSKEAEGYGSNAAGAAHRSAAEAHRQAASAHKENSPNASSLSSSAAQATTKAEQAQRANSEREHKESWAWARGRR